MPSGAKKRKAVKKKKELVAKEPPSHNTDNSLLAHSHGEEDLKHDDKESDSEGGSPASQDHQNHQNQFTQGEGENGEKGLEVTHDPWPVDENKSNGSKHEGKEMEMIDKEDGDAVQVERALKVEGEFESQKMDVENVEGGLRRSLSSSSSSSEDKYAVSEKKNTVVDNASAAELAKENDSSPDTQATESLVGTDKAAISEDVVQVTTSVSDADNVTSSTVESVVKEKGEEQLSAVDGEATFSNTVMANGEEKLGVEVDKATGSEVLLKKALEERDEAASAASSLVSEVSNGNAVANTDTKDSAALEYEDKNAPPDVSVCADKVKMFPACECHDHQLPVVMPPRPVQTTSWKCCCGLFELFAVSNR